MMRGRFISAEYQLLAGSPAKDFRSSVRTPHLEGRVSTALPLLDKLSHLKYILNTREKERGKS